MKEKEYHVARNKKCESCYWWEWESTRELYRGKCTNKFECTRLRYDKERVSRN